jgi:hypothetical protein
MVLTGKQKVVVMHDEHHFGSVTTPNRALPQCNYERYKSELEYAQSLR